MRHFGLQEPSSVQYAHDHQRSDRQEKIADCACRKTQISVARKEKLVWIVAIPPRVEMTDEIGAEESGRSEVFVVLAVCVVRSEPDESISVEEVPNGQWQYGDDKTRTRHAQSNVGVVADATTLDDKERHNRIERHD